MHSTSDFTFRQMESCNEEKCVTIRDTATADIKLCYSVQLVILVVLKATDLLC